MSRIWDDGPPEGVTLSEIEQQECRICGKLTPNRSGYCTGCLLRFDEDDA